MKRFVVTSAVLVLSLVAPALTHGQSNDAEAEKQVRELRNTLNQALLKADGPTLNKVFADDFVIIRPRGMMVGKTVAVSDVETGKTKFESLDDVESNVRIYGNTAVLIYLEKMSGQFVGKAVSAQLRNTYLFVKRDGRWVVVLRQMTPIAAPKPEATPAR
jgi:ketosteroid isomerase-like protein